VLSDLLQLRPVSAGKEPNTTFGNILHRATASFWDALTDSEGFETISRLGPAGHAKDLVEKIWDEEWAGVEVSEKQAYMTKDLAFLILEEYAKNAKLGGHFPGTWRVLELETRRKATLYMDGRQVDVYYQTDRLVENEKGEVALFDTKTASSLSPMWRRTQEQSIQQRLYLALEGQRLGKPLTYAAVEGLLKKGASGTIDYVWINGPWDQDYLNEALLQLHAQAKKDERFLMRVQQQAGEEGDLPVPVWEVALQEALMDPTVVDFNTQDCMSFFRECEYESLCFANPTERFGIALGDFTYEPKDYSNADDS